MSKHMRSPAARGAWPILALTLAATGCDQSSVAPPVEEEILPGAIAVTTVTSGFMQDDGYDLTVDGVSAGTIGSNDQMTLPDLEPGTYQLALGGVADNCTVDPVSVDVEEEQTVDATLSVVCAPGDLQPYTLRFGRARPNLDDGTITECPFSICSTNEGWDLYVYYSSASDPHSVIRQNQTTGVEIAHLPGVALAALTEADVAGATFSAELVADPFDAARVILIRSDAGHVYALGNPVEDEATQTLTFDVALISSAP